MPRTVSRTDSVGDPKKPVKSVRRWRDEAGMASGGPWVVVGTELDGVFTGFRGSTDGGLV
eukprot:1327812-Prymnesium_polylepis.2